MNLILNTELEDELYQACQILFGREVELSREFLFYIQSSGVKSAYRKQALLTHPDRSVHISKGRIANSSELFIKTSDAYEKLRDFIKKRDGGRIVHIPSHGNGNGEKKRGDARAQDSPKRKTAPSGTYYSGSVPNRKLFFGQFLFYSGAISWEALIKAIVWQRNQRPKLGDIAKTWGWLNDAELSEAFRSRNIFEPIGTAAVRLNLLNEGQLRLLLIRQQKLQKPFGEYFVLNNHLSRGHLVQLLREFHKHNQGAPQTAGRYRRTP